MPSGRVFVALQRVSRPARPARSNARTAEAPSFFFFVQAMLATLGVITTEAGFRWPGYISKTLDLKFEDIPGGALDSWAAVPALGWLQIVSFVVLLELAFGQQDPKKEPGDVGGVSWIRYDDPEVKKFKLNVRATHTHTHTHTRAPSITHTRGL